MFNLRPGYLVGFKTHVVGGVRHLRQNLREEDTQSGGREEEWKTLKIIDNKEEFEAISKLRNTISNIVKSKCLDTPFGLICLETDLKSVKEAEAEAQELADAFNKESHYSALHISVMYGWIASNDRVAMTNIAKEMRQLSTQMKDCIANANIDGLRDAAKKVTQMRAMLSDDDQKKINRAVGAARAAANRLAKEIRQGNEDLQKVVPELKTTAIENMRFAFLDMEEQEETDDGEKKAAVIDKGRMAQIEV